MNHLKISLLGPFRVTLNNEPVTQFGADSARALLAYLAIHARIACRRETLAGLLWPDQPEAKARHNLRQALNRLRYAIRDRTKDGNADPPFLLTTRQTIQLNPDSDYWLDVAAFDDLLAASETHEHHNLGTCPSCIECLRKAVEMYQGDLLSGFFLPSALFEEWLVVERERRHRQFLDVLYRLTAHHLKNGAIEQAERYARRQLELEPWRENAHRQLMIVLSACGQRAAALHQYEECKRVLKTELGVPPEKKTTRLYQAIVNGSARTATDSRSKGIPSARSTIEVLDGIQAGPERSPLPVSLTPFVGREPEMTTIAAYLHDPDCRLVTLVGPGGIGKTRLAMEASKVQENAFEHGVLLTSLAPLQSVDAIIPTMAQSLGLSLHKASDPQQQLLDYLRQRNMLLLLDNFEHLLSPPENRAVERIEGINLVASILGTAQGIKILVTSQQRLNIQGEHLLPITGMNYSQEVSPASGEKPGIPSALKLFLHCARRVQPGFNLTDDNWADIVQICRLMEGMPLGILLAASWIDILTPKEMASELRQSLDSFESDLCDLPPRQHSIRAAVDHSWKLLTEREVGIMQALSVFRGGFTRPAAQRVVGATLHDLMSLIHKSLLHRTADGRYDVVHELLRQYAAERLALDPDADQAIHDRHCAYYVAALQQYLASTKSSHQDAILDEMGKEIENTRAAWDWAVNQKQFERLDQAISGMCRLYERLGRYQEGGEVCRAAAAKLAPAVEQIPLAVSSNELRVLAKIRAWQGAISPLIEYTETAGQLFRQGLALLDTLPPAGQKHDTNLSQDARADKALLLTELGFVAFESDYEQAKQLFTQSLALYRELDDRWGITRALYGLGRVAWFLGDYAKAKQVAEESLTLRRAQGDKRGVSDSLFLLGIVAGLQGQIEEAERLAREDLAIRREMGDRAEIAVGLNILSEPLRFAGRYAEAESLLEESISACHTQGMLVCMVISQIRLGTVYLHQGRYEQARDQCRQALTYKKKIGMRRFVGRALSVQAQAALAENAGETAKNLLCESIAADQKTGQPYQLALALAAAGYIERALGRFTEARQHLYQSLRTANEIGAFEPTMAALPAAALLLAEQGETERAIELYALASCYPCVANSLWFDDVAGKHITAIAATLPLDIVTAAQERGRTRHLDTTVKELLAELKGWQNKS
ncbi:MAG: tetratricopeptide repeat protein [Anaerolineae bacterium]|nr:tetratricopeptide repeat protein [Anaerolineae bacterium]